MTSCGGVASTAPSAGFEPTSRAWAEAAAGKASAARTDDEATGLRKDELEQVRPGRDEAAAAVEGLGAVVPALDDDLEPLRAVRDRVALGPLEQLLADALLLVSRMHTELFDPKRGSGFLDRDVAGGLPGQLGDEDGIPRRGSRACAVVALGEGELRDREQRPSSSVRKGRIVTLRYGTPGT